MSRMMLGDKVDRVVQFLLGMGNMRVAGALMAHGFTQAEFDEGWSVFRRAIGEKLSVAPAEPVDVEALDQLDAWENRWFPIARATLDGRMPAIGNEVFLNLAQTDGAEVVISVSTFLKRLDDLTHGDSAHQEARQLLATRGLTPAVCGHAAELLEKLESMQTPPAPSLEDVRAAQDAAEAAMWRWYLEWSAIARASIKDGRLLQQLGFGNRGGRRRGTGDTAADGNGVGEPAPASLPLSPPNSDGA
jgi:hypothetical protein